MATIVLRTGEFVFSTWSGSYGFSLCTLSVEKNDFALFSAYLFWNQLAHLLRIEVLGIIFEVGSRTPPRSSEPALSV